MFRFTIRDLLWLMVVVALAVGWWTERRDKQRNTDLFIKSVELDEIRHRREIDDLKAEILP